MTYNDDLTFAGAIKQETDEAVAFQPVGHPEAVWLPRSQIDIVECVGRLECTLPRWLAQRKGLY